MGWNSMCKGPVVEAGMGESRCLQEKMLDEKSKTQRQRKKKASRFHLPKGTLDETKQKPSTHGYLLVTGSWEGEFTMYGFMFSFRILSYCVNANHSTFS